MCEHLKKSLHLLINQVGLSVSTDRLSVCKEKRVNAFQNFRFMNRACPVVNDQEPLFHWNPTCPQRLHQNSMLNKGLSNIYHFIVP